MKEIIENNVEQIREMMTCLTIQNGKSSRSVTFDSITGAVVKAEGLTPSDWNNGHIFTIEVVLHRDDNWMVKEISVDMGMIPFKSQPFGLEAGCIALESIKQAMTEKFKASTSV